MGQEDSKEIPISTSVELLTPLTIPSEFDSIPRGETLIHQLEYFVSRNFNPTSEQFHQLSILRQQKEAFEKSNYIIFNFADFGLGDAIIQLQYAQAIAREFDQQDQNGKYRKKILVLVPPAIKAISSFTLPENLVLYETIDDVFAAQPQLTSTNCMIIQMLRGPVETLIDLERKPFSEQTTEFIIPRSQKEARKPELKVDVTLEILKRNHRWVLPIDTRLDQKDSLPYDELIASLIIKHNLQNYSQLDLNFVVLLKLLNASTEVRNITSPLFDLASIEKQKRKYRERSFWQKKVPFDLAVAFDAGESTYQDKQTQYYRSRKSPQAQTVETVFSLLHRLYPDLKIAVVPGTKHREYSQDIYKRIQNYYPKTAYIETKTFDDMIGLFGSSRVVLTADSVTRWIAEAMIRTEIKNHPQQSAIRLVTLHNGVLIPYELYGPRVQPVLCLGYMPKDQHLHYELSDIQIPADQIVSTLVHALQTHQLR